MNVFGLIAVGLMLSSALALTANSLVQPLLRTAAQLWTRNELDVAISQMGLQIKGVGRHADDCQRIAQTLVCTLPPMTTHNQANQPVQARFILTSQGLEYQKEDSPNNWTQVLIAKGVNKFTVCDANDMQLHQCTAITPLGLSEAYARLSPTEIFLRYRLEATATNFNQVYQSSFSLRNSSPTTFSWN